MRKIPIILAILFCAISHPIIVHADTGLAMRCDGVTVPTQAAACTGSRSWVHPAPGEAILSMSTVPTDSSTIAWSAPDLQFRVAPPATYGVLTCTKDLPAPSIIPVGGTDPCAPGADKVAKVFVPEPLVVPLPGPITSGTVNFAWTAPTANTDGTPVADIMGYNIYRGATCAALTVLNTALVSGLTYSDTNLAPGPYCYAISSVSKSEGESPQSSSITVQVPVPAPASKPSPPGSFTAQCVMTLPAGMKGSCTATPSP